MRAADRPEEPRASVPLAPLTTLGVGGPAQWYLRATTPDDVRAAHAWARTRGLPVLALGGGSNIVVADQGVPGLVLHMAVEGVDVRAGSDDAVVVAGAGEPWDPLVGRLVGAGYAGLECLSGIPGSVGGTPIQNVGAYGQEVAGAVERVTAVDAGTGEVVDIPAADCGFTYRHSRFKQHAGRYLVCRVAYRVRREAPTVTYPDVVNWLDRHHLSTPDVADVRRAVLDIRKGKGMVLDASDPDTRSVGSFFMNPVVSSATQAALGAPGFPQPDGAVKVPAAWLIERAGFARGFTAGAAGLSSKHPLALVNRGGATSAEIVDLACRIKRAVLVGFGVTLRPEPVFAGFGGDERVRFLLKEE